MSSKTKKKAAGADSKSQTDNGASAAPKKVKIPKAFIARPSETKKQTTVYLQPQIADAMELTKGQFVVVSKESGPGVVALLDIDDSEDSNVLRIPQALRHLGGILLGDRLQISGKGKQPTYAKEVEVKIENLEDWEGLNTRAKKAFTDAGVLQPGLELSVQGTPVTITRITDASSSLESVTAKLSEISLESSADLALVSPAFLFHTSTTVKASTQDVDFASYPRIPRPSSLEHVGGLDKPISLLRSTVNLPLHHPTLFSDFGISPPRGILLHGPPGTGKTMLLRCVAHESGAHVLMINGPSVVSKYLGETENAIRDLFAEAVKYQPSIIIMDEIDSLAPKRGSDDAGETESRVVATLLTMMDGMGDSGRVVVVGATNRPNSIDPALRRPGRFDQEVEIGIPDVEARADILAKQLTRMKSEKCNLSNDDIKEVASKTHGYVGADLAALCREGVMKTIARGLSGKSSPVHIGTIASLDLSNIDHIDPDVKVEKADLEAALLDVRPSAMREIFLEMPKVSWDDIGGQHELKQKLTEVVQLPLEASETFASLGISAPKGVLLYGPPGCSKTLTAKALASESGLNFLAVKGPEIFNKYVGESERTIREIFRKARAAAPSIIFFDEIDALASSREEASTSAAQHVLTSLLNEIDGVEELNGVVIVAATNRPTEIDAALLRPGRLDRHIYVAPPDHEARLHILNRKCSRFDVENASELFERLSQATEGCSGAEVALLCQEAGLAAIMEDKTTRKVEERHFDHALKSISKGITPDMLEYYREFSHRSGLTM
ncbi:hypothetical protein FT663_01503 [Candidozyma haemuli var. vulneris]|uniref:AAA+ ATPase domain-containing protein n=1 Tax=Candidozyma haemuli TaxID=45357 RepID=A0A2V1ATK0_9ASCO|nr:hypothetical protein CXQ85_000124 [[Candida] haemuloni]KAF3990131.1 hypothetical protein FT662_02455 [[Candida] haemuloni var. vulneris]KAF3994383.1 hypothetical protein FT663_01503 [[Candida] haemuloni var. vulneris]PVH21159.1 hypothetical protein CXQ85_000124 [[Candida] haemuloni]